MILLSCFNRLLVLKIWHMSLKVYVTKNRHMIFKVSKKVNSYITSQKTESELCSLNGTLFVNLFKALLSK